MRKGQITIFIIMGIALLAVIGLVVYYKQFLVEKEVEQEIVRGSVIAPEISEVGDFLQGCIRDVSKNSMEFVFAQGGLWQPLPYFSQGPLEVAYWYYEGKDNTPSLDKVEEDLAEFVTFYLPECMGEFDKPDMVIINVEPKTKATISNSAIRFEVSYPIIVDYKETFFSVPEESFVVEFLSDFKKVYETGKQVVRMELDNPEYVDASMLIEVEEDVTYLPSTSDEGLYLISGKTTSLMFANKFLINESAEEEGIILPSGDETFLTNETSEGDEPFPLEEMPLTNITSEEEGEFFVSEEEM